MTTKSDISPKIQVVNVTPISKGILKDTLSYFTAKKISSGDIVSVSLRNKKIDALVISVEDVSAIKSKLRAEKYSLKKVEENKGKSFLLPELMGSFEEIKNFYASSLGSIINSLVPQIIFKNLEKITQKKESYEPVEKSFGHEVVILQADEKTRISTYKNIIRGEFARGKSVFLCLPQISDIEKMKVVLEKGIEKYSFSLHSKISKTKLLDTWNKIIEQKHPVLIIATGLFLSIPRDDIATIILDKEGSNIYKMISRPFVDIRIFAKIFAKHKKIRLILGDVFLKPETIWKYKQGEIAELNNLQFRSLSYANQKIIDMSVYKTIQKNGKKEFILIGDELLNLIQKNIDNKENLFILVSRRGLYTSTVCNDCGSIVLCKECRTPLILHKKTEIGQYNYFTCHKCGYHTKETDKCQSCYSWKLTPLGIGIERAEEVIKKKFKGLKIFRIDKDCATDALAKKISKEFKDSIGSVLIGTEMAMSYLSNIENTAVLSLDSLFSIPDFRINEKIFRLLLEIRSKASKNFLIQTRYYQEKIFEFASKGDLMGFYKEEIKEREALGYPPFNLFIKISYSGFKQKVITEIEKLSEILKDFKPISFEAFAPEIKKSYTMHIIIKIKPEKWPDIDLVNILYSLPLYFKVNVDPESLL